jgi:peptidyl-prolyl cis-trans isomerase C
MLLFAGSPEQESEPADIAPPTDHITEKPSIHVGSELGNPSMVHARHILVACEPTDSPAVRASKRAQAEEIRREILGGADFAEAARRHSNCPSKEKGGDLGFFTRKRMVKSFEKAAFSQTIGEIGPVVETQYGYHIIQVLEIAK